MEAKIHRIAQNGGSSWTPSLAPFALAENITFPTSAPTGLRNHLTVNNPNEIPVINFILYLFICMFVLIGLVYCNQRKAAAIASSNSIANTALTNFHQRMNSIEGMSPEERKEYVTNVLKTQKFENKGITASFRIKQSSSTRVLNESTTPENGDLESNPAVPSCAICLDPFQDGEDICSAQNAQCPHEFHLTCIFPWLLKSQECPCCRRDYLSPAWESDAITNPSQEGAEEAAGAARTGN